MNHPQKKCAFLSTDNLEEFFVYDQMLIEPLAKKGWKAEEISWRKSGVEWDEFDVVVVRSTWDYQQAPEDFLARLEEIDNSNAVLDNSLRLIKWNIDKLYLQDLESREVPIVPTLWFEEFDYKGVLKAFEHFEVETLVIKPTISANADDTFKLSVHDLAQKKHSLNSLFRKRSLMVQPFMTSIIEEGEYSLFYFNGDYSHAILKVPKKQDFRVQEEHGGQLHSVNPDSDLIALAEKTMGALPELPLYARLDFVRTEEGYVVMEIELIEPSLYFNMDEQSPEVFAEAFVSRYS